jgi:Xaa-Pro aminopeptidase
MIDPAMRRKRVLEGLAEGVEAFLVSNQSNVRYLTGFTGSNGQLLLGGAEAFLTDGRYTEQSAGQVPDLVRHTYGPEGLGARLAEILREAGVRRLGVEATCLTLEQARKLGEALDGIDLVPLTDTVEPTRMRKDPDEVDAIVRAQRVAERALTETLSGWTGGTEIELALAIEWAIRSGGAEAVSFDVIVASGTHSALPHARPRDVEIGAEDLVLVDIGARVDGYCSDMTRTYLRGAPDPMPRVHAAVVRAVEACVEAIRPGVTCVDADKAARDVLVDEGWGEQFVHSTGHGVGLDIHEEPKLATTSERTLEAGMVVTVEPGVYLPGVGGVRVEDLLLVTDDGAEVLTALDRGPSWPASV